MFWACHYSHVAYYFQWQEPVHCWHGNMYSLVVWDSNQDFCASIKRHLGAVSEFVGSSNPHVNDGCSGEHLLNQRAGRVAATGEEHFGHGLG